MFDGRGTKPKALIGKRDAASRDEVLQAAAAARAARSVQVRNEAAALVVQKQFRSFAARKKFRSNAAHECHARTSDLQKLQAVFAATGKTFVPPWPVVVRLLRQFYFTGGSIPKDAALKLLGTLVQLVKAASQGPHNATHNEAASASTSYVQACAGLLVQSALATFMPPAVPDQPMEVFLSTSSDPYWQDCIDTCLSLLHSGACTPLHASLLLLSQQGRASWTLLYMALLQACAQAEADRLAAQVYSHPISRLLLSLPALCCTPVPALSTSMSDKVAQAIGGLVLRCPMLAACKAQGGGQPVLAALPTSPLWPAALQSLLSWCAQPSPPALGAGGRAAKSMQAVLTFGNIVQLHAGHSGACVPQLLPALSSLLHCSPHVAWSCVGGVAAKERAMVQEQAGVGAGVDMEVEGEAKMGVEDAILEYGDTEENIQAAAERNAELAYLLAHRGRVLTAVAGINGRNGLGLETAGEQQARVAAENRGEGLHFLGSPSASSSSFSGGTSMVTLFALGGAGGLAGGKGSVQARIQQYKAAAAVGQGMQGSAAASTPFVSPSSKPRSRRGSPQPCTFDSLTAALHAACGGVLGIAPLATQGIQAQLHAMTEASSLTWLLQQSLDPLQAVHACAMLHALLDKVRVQGYLTFMARPAARGGGQWAGVDMEVLPSMDLTAGVSGGTRALLASLIAPLPQGRARVGAKSLLHAAWEALAKNPALSAFTHGSASDALVQHAEVGAALTLIHEALAYACETVDDVTLCEEGRPLPTHTVRALLQCTKAVLHRIAWADKAATEIPLTKRSTASLSLLVHALAAFNGLYDRHVRRPSWLVGEGEDQAGAGARVGRQSLYGQAGGAVEAGDALFLWPPLPPSDLTADSVLGLAEVAVADESMAVDGPQEGGRGTGAGEGAGDGESRGAARTAAVQAAVIASGADQEAVAAHGMGAGSAARKLRSNRTLLVLTSCPFVIPFHQRVELFTALRSADKEERSRQDMLWAAGLGGQGQGRIQFTVRRSSQIADAYTALSTIPSDRLKERWWLEFTNADGLPEAGIDGGGLLKEFIDSTVREAFSPAAGLFRPTGGQLMYPNPDPLPPVLGAAVGSSGSPWTQVVVRTGAAPSPTQLYEFLGVLLGKAMYEGILVEPRFAPFVLRRLLGKSVGVDDLTGYDPQLAKSLAGLLKQAQAWKEAGSIGPDPIADLCLTMACSEEVAGSLITVPLVPHGDTLPVTAASLGEYVHRLAKYRLHTSIAGQVRAFLRGFRQYIPLPWMSMFGAGELAVLLGGKEGGGFDVQDLKAHTGYGGGYHADHATVKTFWRVLESLSPADQSAFLAFVTSCPRPPLLGFAHLHPKFGVSRIPISSDGERLPIAATCANLLKLPTYSSEQVMREKLLYAIHSGAGFELT